MFESISPADLGLPKKFQSFRRSQIDGLDWALYDCTKRWTAASMPTGSGKSLYALALARSLGVKAVYLTATKGLQEQVLADAREIGMVDVRGRGNYRCKEIPRANCTEGLKDGCAYAADSRCPAKEAVEIGEQSQLVVSNYAWWLHSGGMDGVGLLICDEMHAVPELLADFMTVSLSCNTYDSSGLMDEPQGEVWRTWAAAESAKARTRQKEIEKRYKLSALARRDEQWQELDEQIEQYSKVARMHDGFVWESLRGTIRFTPIWPGRFASALWQSVPRILLISATLRPYTLSLLGLARDSYDFREWPSVFPPQRSPVYSLPTAKLSCRSTDEDYQKIVDEVDSILAARADRKGIIHTVSYSRMQTILTKSKHRSRFIFNTGSNGAGAGHASVSSAIDAFRRALPGAVLVSPSVSAGYDFAADAAEFQIILKVPFPDTSTRVMKERCKDSGYRFYVAAQTLVQMCGRAMRSADDRSETFILDSTFAWLMSQGRKFMPGYFKTHPITKIPIAPPKIIVDREATIGVK